MRQKKKKKNQVQNCYTGLCMRNQSFLHMKVKCWVFARLEGRGIILLFYDLFSLRVMHNMKIGTTRYIVHVYTITMVYFS
jgi:hypothetical protein